MHFILPFKIEFEPIVFNNIFDTNKLMQVYKDEMASKRRSYHPQEYLSQVLHDQPQFIPNQCQRARPSDFPKVSI